MRLLTLKPSPITSEPTLVLEEFLSNIPPYTILSHRWGADHEEVSFKDIDTSSPNLKTKKGYAKIMNCYAQTVSDGFEYLWADTCCIDKSSSAELSEGINSMYGWYKNSMICYAYLEDVKSEEDPRGARSSFRRSAWFTRGWTLQELLAPQSVVMFARDWVEIGTKESLGSLISKITSIDRNVLAHQNYSDCCVAQKMSWAAMRTTTRVEDRAYSLLGLFGVNMAAIYGEGEHAFHRLQIEILNLPTDQSIFAWNSNSDSPDVSMLAASPDCFADSTNIDSMKIFDFVTNFGILDYTHEYAMTNAGIQIHMPLLPVDDATVLKELGIAAIAHSFPMTGLYLGFIACKPTNSKSTIAICIILEKLPEEPGSVFFRKSAGGFSTFQVDTSRKRYDLEKATAQSISVRKNEFANEHELREGPNKFRCSFLLDTSRCDSFEVIEKSPDYAWDSVYSYAGVLLRCVKTQQTCVASIQKYSGHTVLCDLASVDSTVDSIAHAYPLATENEKFLTPRGTSDWAVILREGQPGRIVATARRSKNTEHSWRAYTLKIVVYDK